MNVLLKAVYSLLSGQLTYDGQPVPVYDKKRRVNMPATGLFVVLAGQRETDEPQTSDAFITLAEIDIELWHITEYEVSSDPINDVSNQLLQRLTPSPETDGFPVQNLFLIQNVRRVSASLEDFSIGQTDTLLRKNITISATITEQNP